ncbi:MAG: DUF4349 domain-containing protein, partial [Bacillota bacterium]|nr:DUF4349 domain-containing protein [Bacillota bacterium]
MKCEDIRRYFSEYIDNEAPEEIASSIEKHLTACGECRRELESLRKFKAAFSSVGEEELPFDFNLRLQAALQEETQCKKKAGKAKPWLRTLAACACLVLCLGLIGLASNALGIFSMGASAPMEKARDMQTADVAFPEEEYIIADGSAYAIGASEPLYDNMAAEFAETEEVAAEAPSLNAGMLKRSSPESSPIERKIIKNYNLSLQVEDFDSAYAQISDLASEYGGYVVSGNTSDYEGSVVRHGWLSIRVDAMRADEVVDRIAELGSIEENSFSSNDVTSEYYDTQTRLEQYRAQEERLLALYEKAESIEDLIALESEMTRVIAEIEAMEGNLRYYDQLTSLSLIDINLYTPNNYTKTVEPTGWEGFLENVKSGFLRGVNGLLDGIASVFIFIVRILPSLIVIGLIAALLLLFIRRRRRKNSR